MNSPAAALLSVASSVLVGGVLAVVPWTSWWDNNQLIQPYSALKGLLLSPFARGAVSGLGLVNLLIALHEVREAWHAHGRHD